MRPCRLLISAIFARSGGPPAAALTTSADSRKYCGPTAAGVITQSTLTSRISWGRIPISISLARQTRCRTSEPPPASFVSRCKKAPPAAATSWPAPAR